MPLNRAEATAASSVTFLASAILTAYLSDRFGFRIAPFFVLAVSVASAAIVLVRLRAQSAADRGAAIGFTAIFCAGFASLVWLARPDFLPTGSGPDLAHHLALVDYIERHRSLVHDLALSEYLGEMITYTPGVHLLAMLAGAWFRIGALHVVHTMVAFTVALKAGFVFLIARRLVPADQPRDAFAAIAVLLLLLPYSFSVGSFTEESYLAQVVSELFAVAMWWAAAVWDERRWRGAPFCFAAWGAAVFLTWPVWIGPPLLMFGGLALLQRERPYRERISDFVIAVAPIGAIAAVYLLQHPSGYYIVGTGGFVIRPTFDRVGPWFALTASAAVITTAACRRMRPAMLLLAAIAIQAAALVIPARSAGAATPYLALKMFYLAIYPMTVAVAPMLAAIWRVARPASRLRSPLVEWAAVAAVGVAVAAPLAATQRPRPAITEAVLRAGEWASGRLPRGCIDYLTRDTYTAYWLHVGVLGNPRASLRTADADTFDPGKAVVRWILPGGLPFAISDDFEALPRDVRTNVDVLVRFGPAAVVQRHGPSKCPSG